MKFAISIVITFIVSALIAVMLWSTKRKSIYYTISKDDLKVLVHRRASSYFDKMSHQDLVARSQSSMDEYKNTYSNSFTALSSEEKQRLQILIQKANILLDNSGFSKIRDIPWTIVKIKKDIENGFPHTLADVIVISDKLLQENDEYVVQTLIHEKIHVYQRQNRTHMKRIIQKMGMRPLTNDELKVIDDKIKRHLRANPDLDDKIYLHEPTGLVMSQIYTSSTPKSISNSKTVFFHLKDGGLNSLRNANNKSIGLPTSIYCQLEHPYEIMACLLAELITKPELLKKVKNNRFVKAVYSD